MLLEMVEKVTSVGLPIRVASQSWKEVVMVVAIAVPVADSAAKVNAATIERALAYI
jgi:hypothetical protein